MPELMPCPACGSKSIEIDWDNGVHFMKCERCGVSGPCFIDEYPREFVADAWNALPRMSAIIAWQFQAAGAALALQRLMDAAQAMREAQRAYEEYCSNEDSVTEAEAIFDGLLDDVRRTIGGHDA